MADQTYLLKEFMSRIEMKNSHEPEFLQAVHEVAETIIPFMEDHDKYKAANILERICEPERALISESHGLTIKIIFV